MRRRRKGPETREHYHKLLRESGNRSRYQESVSGGDIRRALFAASSVNTHPVFTRDICEKRQLSAGASTHQFPRD